MTGVDRLSFPFVVALAVLLAAFLGGVFAEIDRRQAEDYDA